MNFAFRGRSTERAGFSLFELVAVLGIIGFLLIGIFALFSFSSRGFQHAVLRQGLSGESESIQRKLQDDYRASHLGTVAIVERDVTMADGQDVERDAFSFATLSDWQDPARFSPIGLPRWDRYVVYYATTSDRGSLVRQVVDPGVLAGPIPYRDLSTNIDELPLNNDGLVQSSLLSKNVLSFKVERDDARQLLEVNLKLRRIGGQRANANSVVDETQELVFSIEAFNTYPRL